MLENQLLHNKKRTELNLNVISSVKTILVGLWKEC